MMLSTKELRETYEYVVSRIVGEKVTPRPGLIEVLERLCKGYFTVLSAPPGYGKTSITFTHAYLSAKTMGPWAPRIIHVLPLRSIAEEIYDRLFHENGDPKIKELNKESVARQMLSYPEAPSLQKTLIFTTIDTYLLTSIRLPPGEYVKIKKGLSLGHGEYSRSSLALSATIFDEIQLFIEEGSRTPSAFQSLLAWLMYLENPVVVMSATIPSIVENFIVSTARSFSREVKVIKYGRDFRDADFENTKLSNKIETTCAKLGDSEEYVKTVMKELRNNMCYDRILIISNTVKKAVKIAKKIREELDNKTMVLHGKIVSEDRKNILKKIEKLRNWILISTQVVEAGVNISAQMLFTEASTPTSLIQRIGRLLRREINEEGKLLILYDKSEEQNNYYTVYPKTLVQTCFKHVLEKHKRIFWHLPYTSQEDTLGYEKLIEETYANSGFEIKIDNGIYNVLKHLLFKCKSPKYSLRAIETYGNLVREQPLVLGTIDLNETFKLNKKYEFKDVIKELTKYSLPLNLKDIIKLAKLNVPALIVRNDSLECVELRTIFNKNARSILYKILHGNLISIVIPKKLYDRFYGLLL